jgi:hypothetical protein
MYHPKPGKEREQSVRRPERNEYLRAALHVLTAVFWVAAVICAALIVVTTFTEGIGTVLSWAIGISLLLVVLSSGAITWVEFRNNSVEDVERGEWTNKMLFYGLVFAITFFVAFLYLPALFFAR